MRGDDKSPAHVYELNLEAAMDFSKALLDGFATFLGGAIGTAVFLMPGYVMGKTFAGGVRGPAPTERAFLATTAAGGLLIHVSLLWWTIPLYRSVLQRLPEFDAGQYIEVLMWAVIVLAALPAMLGAIAARLADMESGPVYRVLRFLGLTTATRTAEAWNWAFREAARSAGPAWLRIRLKNKGGAYYGHFGPRSLAASDATVRDIYLQRTWPLDASGQPAPAEEDFPNRGIWIAGEQIMTVEFIPRSNRETDDERGQGQATD